MVTVRHYHRHLHNHRLDTLFEPALPLPLGVRSGTGLYEVTREEAETCFRYSSGSRRCATVGVVNVLLILNMTIRHIDETELTLLCVLRTEMTNFTPMTCVTYTPTVRRTRSQVLCYRLVTHILEGGLRIQSRSFQNTRSRNSITKRLRGRRSSSDTNHITALKVRSRRIRHRQNLNHTVCDSFVGKPRESHTGMRVAVDISHHVIRLFLAHQLSCCCIHRLQFTGNSCFLCIRSLETVHTSCLLCNQERNPRRNSVVRLFVQRISCQHLVRIDNR